MSAAAGRPLLGAIEGGGTKFFCAVGYAHDAIVDRLRIPTTTGSETLARVIEFFRAHRPSAVGIGMFGPIELDRRAGEHFGRTLQTPKPGWDDVPVHRRLQEELGVPVALDKDVNAATLAESLWGAGQDADPLVYITVGTGIGGGVRMAGELLHGLLHSEMGHIMLPQLPNHWAEPDSFAGVCRFHGRCWEGLCSGPALHRRTGMRAEDLPAEHPVWNLFSGFMAQGIANVVLTLAPQKVVLGGGVMQLPHAWHNLRSRVCELVGPYMQRPQVQSEGIERYLMPAALPEPGLSGAFALAVQL